MIQVTCAVIFSNNKVFVARRGEHPHHAFQWEFPGGKVKPGESEEQSIFREIKEELDVDVEIAEQMTPVDFDYGFRKIRLIPFLCFLKDGEITLNEHIDYRWVEWQELENMNLSEADEKLFSLPQNRQLLEKYSGEKMNNSG